MKDLSKDVKDAVDMQSEEGRARANRKQQYIFALQRREDMRKQIEELEKTIKNYEKDIAP